MEAIYTLAFIVLFLYVWGLCTKRWNKIQKEVKDHYDSDNWLI